ncbi:hypothetical protein DFH07DRAFT_35885 [Mycena maculata]|uniref:F-box domain-containing protein n=1 Tax=Mycena maculata TaxID=230809 RepID=A0AAD7IHT9_9AGAR|nr:hypothetical protein DFH07DRAFT_35885 [Mycena maculata]
MRSALYDLHDDVLIYLFSLLDLPGILVLRQTCTRMQKISELRIVWTNACNHHILRRHYPFPEVAIEDLSVSDLEKYTRHAYRLASRWRSCASQPPSVFCEFDATNGTPVSELRFVPGHNGNWLLAASKGIWSILSLWELSDTGSPPVKRFEWSRRGVLVHGFVLNDDKACDAALAVSITQTGNSHVEIMSLREDVGFRSICTIYSPLNPVHFHGDRLILSDPIDVAVVMNWRTGASAILQRPQDASQSAISINDRCIQVVASVEGILVVRARTLTLFRNPPLTLDTPIVHAPIAVHSFGWVDGVAVTTIVGPSRASSTPPPLSILIRPEPDDPWAPDDAHVLDLYVLHPAVEPHGALPYAFPPAHAARVPSARGSLHCSTLRLGPHGTAVWIEPHDRAAAGLLHAMQDDTHAPVARQNERLVGAAFPGPLFPVSGTSHEYDYNKPLAVLGTTLRANELNNWKALDYDEVQGLVAVASTRGRITVLELVGPLDGR